LSPNAPWPGRARRGLTVAIPLSLIALAAPSAAAAGELGPARAHERDCNGAGTQIRARNNTRYLDCPGVSLPDNAQHVTIVGSQLQTGVLKGVRDIYIGGRPGRLMDAGPRADGGDLLQIKRWPVATGPVPTGIMLRWIRFHDVTRPGSEHPDGIQVMAGRYGRILDCVFERVDVQPIFFRYAGTPAGGGPIENWTIKRTRIERPPNGYYAIRIAGNGDDYVPTGIRLRNLRLTGNVSVDRSAFRAGFDSSGLRGGRVVVSGG
jgi:hypothetical protein